MLKFNGSDRLTEALALLLDFMIEKQVCPEVFNVSIIKPLIKDANKANDDINNVHPVAVSDAIANLYERFLLQKVNSEHRDVNQQFGFRSNSSCNHAAFLLKIASKTVKTRGQRLYACAIDASKAFDKVSRKRLWLKMIEKGISSQVIIAIIKYYEFSYLMVQLGDEFSSLFKSTLGVRQGGVLSPKLFAIYIEDIAEKVNRVPAVVKLIDQRIKLLLKSFINIIFFLFGTKEDS